MSNVTETTYTPARPRRLTLSEIVEMLLTKSHDRSHVSLSRTAAGDVVIDVKVTAETVEEAGALAQAELERLSEMYPRDDRSKPTVSLTRNAKGDTQVDVKGNGWDETQKVYDVARMAYPMSNGLSAKPGSVT
jgi:hypothetical protein